MRGADAGLTPRRGSISVKASGPHYAEVLVMKLLVVGSLKDVPSYPDLCGTFITKLGEQIVERGHTLLNGCRGSLDTAIAKAAEARLRALGRRPENQLVGYRLSEAEPAHRSGVIRISKRKDWDLTHPQLEPPEQIAESDAAIFVAGSQGTFIAANWARIAGIPVLGVSEFGGAGKALYAFERLNLAKTCGRSVTQEEFDILNQDTTDMAQLASDVVNLAERIVIPRSVFPVLPFSTPYADVKDTFQACCRDAGLELEDIEQEATTARIIPRIIDGIRRAAFIVADISESRPNVFFEIGLAHGLNKPTVLTAKVGTIIPFDMGDNPVLFWDTQRSLREQLSRRLQALSAKRGRGIEDVW